MGSLKQLCRICSDDLKEDGVEIFSAECMEQLVGEKIKRYLYFSVSIKDDLPKRVCDVCLKKLDNIHRFAKMAAQMQEKFRMLLAQEETAKPKIKIRSFQDLSKDVTKEETKDNKEEEESNQNGTSEAVENGTEGELSMCFDVAVEEVGGEGDGERSQDAVQDAGGPAEPNGPEVAAGTRIKLEKDLHEEEDIADDDGKEDLKPSASLLHSLLLQGKATLRTRMDIDHDYPAKGEQQSIKEEPEDPEDDDIAAEIEEDRLNQIIKDEMESETEGDESGGSDVEVTEMEVKVDPMLYFSNTSQSAIDIDQDSQDTTPDPTSKQATPSTSKSSDSVLTAANCNSPLVMTRSQQRNNPVIAGLKLGKPYKCTVCPRSFITDIGLQNHLWSHLPKARKTGQGGQTNVMIHKNVDLEDSQVYSSNGVLHTAMPSENPHLLKYACPICGKKISTKGNLKVHLETHRPKGKYGCDICGRVFKTGSNLYRHKDYHGGVQFPCGVCGRVYPTNSTLRAHSITHSDLRPHKCPLCSKTFKRNQDLKFHINQHTGARPYQCPYCPKAFASSGNCFSHRKRMHPMEVERDKERAAEIMG